MKLTRRHLKGRRSIRFYKYFLSYALLAFTLLFLVSTIMYSNFIKTLEHEIEVASVLSLTQIRDSVDMLMKDMGKISVQIASNPDTTPYMVAEAGYPTYRAIAEMGKYRSSNSMIYDLALLYTYRNTDKVYAASGVYSYDTFFGHIYHYENWNEEQVLQTLGSMTAPVVRSLENVRKNNVIREKFVTYMYPLPAQQEKPYGAVLFMFEESSLRGILNPDSIKDSGYMYILDPMNQPIISLQFDPASPEPERFLEGIDINSMSEQTSFVKFDKEDYSLTKLTSEFNDWSYVVAIPSHQYLHGIESSRRVFYYTLFAIFILGIVMSFALANNNYKSLRSIVQLIAERKKMKDNYNNMDELVYISQAFDEVISEKASLMSKLGSRSGMLRERVLLSLLQGRQDLQHNEEDFLEMSGLQFEHPYFVTILFIIDDYHQFELDNTKSLQNLFKFSIVNIAEELCSEVGRGYGVDLIDDVGIAFILNLRDGKQTYEHINSVLSKIQQFYLEYYKFSLSAGVGSVYDDLNMICYSYDEAKEAAIQHFIKGNGQIIYYKQIKAVKRIDYRYPIHLEEQLAMLIKQGKGDEAQQFVTSIIAYAHEKSYTVDAARNLCAGIANLVLNTLGQINTALFNEFKTQLQDLYVMEYDTMASFGIRLGDFCKQVGDHIAEHKESKNSSLRDEILFYIGEHYSNSLISPDYIAERFNLSSSYVSRFVKDQTGHSLKEHVDQLRMNEARHLLKHTDLTVKHIVEHVGYVDDTNFIRKFKKLEGLTPIQYRNASSIGTTSR